MVRLQILDLIIQNEYQGAQLQTNEVEEPQTDQNEASAIRGNGACNEKIMLNFLPLDIWDCESHLLQHIHMYLLTRCL